MKYLSFALIMMGGLLFSSCSSSQTDENTTVKKVVNLPKVKTAKSSLQDVEQLIEFSGNIEPYYKNHISSSSAQRVESILVEVGDRVKKGDILVKMEDINFAQANIQYENLKVDLARMEALYKSGGVSAQQYDQILTQVKVTKESLDNLEKNTKLISPIDGIITQRNFDNGDLTVGQPILTVMQLEPVKFLINISEEFFPAVKSGTNVKISLDIYENKDFDGEINLVYPTIDPATRTFKAQVRIENNSMKLRPGMFARASVDFGKKERIVVSDKAVVKQNGTNDKFIYVLNSDNTVDYRKVQVGNRIGSIYEILSGLEAGEQVVVAGQTRLIDKAKVIVDNSREDLNF